MLAAMCEAESFLFRVYNIAWGIARLCFDSSQTKLDLLVGSQLAGGQEKSLRVRKMRVEKQWHEIGSGANRASAIERS